MSYSGIPGGAGGGGGGRAGMSDQEAAMVKAVGWGWYIHTPPRYG